MLNKQVAVVHDNDKNHILSSSAAPLRVDRIVKDFGTTRAVDNVSLTCQEGEFLALLWPSGSGKTSILMSIAGFEMLTSYSRRYVSFSDNSS